MTTTNRIPTPTLFADLQVSLTEIFLINLLHNDNDYHERMDGNCHIVNTIKKIMQERFTDEEIAGFLENGYPRQVDLSDIA